eukprot:365431-Chlamydomonas_euryale.AAC.18
MQYVTSAHLHLHARYFSRQACRAGHQLYADVSITPRSQHLVVCVALVKVNPCRACLVGIVFAQLTFLGGAAAVPGGQEQRGKTRASVIGRVTIPGSAVRAAVIIASCARARRPRYLASMAPSRSVGQQNHPVRRRSGRGDRETGHRAAGRTVSRGTPNSACTHLHLWTKRRKNDSSDVGCQAARRWVARVKPASTADRSVTPSSSANTTENARTRLET